MQLEVLELARMLRSGECVARHAGMDIFVPFGIPSEVVEAEIVHRRRHSARARIIKILQASPNRVAAPCPHFGHCGGCDWQHIAYGAQLQFKREIVHEQLENIGGFDSPTVQACIPSPNEYHYRNRIQLVASAYGRLGYRTSTRNVVEIEDCDIASAPINQLLRTVFPASQSASVDLRMDNQNAYAISSTGKSYSPLELTIGAHTYRVTGPAFF